MGSIFYSQKEEYALEVKDLPQITQSTESDFAVSSTSQKTRLISFKNIFEKISFSLLATKAKNIIGAINELNTDSQWKKITVPEPSVSDGSRIYTIDLSTYKEICIRIWIMAWLGSVDIKIIPLNMSTKKYIHCYYDGTYYANAEVTVTQNDITVKTVASNMTSSNYYLIGELCAR